MAVMEGCLKEPKGDNRKMNYSASLLWILGARHEQKDRCVVFTSREAEMRRSLKSGVNFSSSTEI
jgi:hypothetical protein